MKETIEAAQESSSGPEPVFFECTSMNPEISKYIKLFSLLREQRIRSCEVNRIFVFLERELRVLIKIYDYVMGKSSPGETQATVECDKIEFRRSYSKAFAIIVMNLRDYYTHMRANTSLTKSSIEAHLDYLNQDALNKLKSVPETAQKFSNQTDAPNAQGWSSMKKATYAAGAAVTFGTAGGFGVYELVSNNAPEAATAVAEVALRTLSL
jgi:hypothetical protein